MGLNRRQRDILDWLHEVDRLTTEQLADRFNVSSQTIRRDINDLDEQGTVRRVHGGLSLPTHQHNQSFLQRSNVGSNASAVSRRRLPVSCRTTRPSFSAMAPRWRSSREPCLRTGRCAW